MAYVVDKVPAWGTQAAQPASGSITMTAVPGASGSASCTLHFVFNAARITVTDTGAGGSSGSIKLFTFKDGVVQLLSSRHNWTAFAEGTALTTAAGDAAFIIAFGSVAADAGDGALTATEVDFGAATATLTNTAGTTTSATKVTSIQTPLDGTSTAVAVFLNWSGSAATIDANSTFDLTGTYTMNVIFVGDD